MINWPQDLVLDIARRRCVIFVGAGVSKNAVNAQNERPMDWKEFLRHLEAGMPAGEPREAVNKCIASGDLLTACEIVRTSLGRNQLITALLANFSQKRFQYSLVHENLVALDSRIVLTTNFDKLYENAANAILHGDILTKTYTDREIADVIRRQNRCIIKVHGSVDTPGETILTRVDYAKARSLHAHFYKVMDALFMTHTFVFLGASMRDPDIALVLEDYAHRYQSSRPHYVVMPTEDLLSSELQVLEECLNLKAIPYSNAENHRELTEGIDDLKRKVESARSGLLDTMDW